MFTDVDALNARYRTRGTTGKATKNEGKCNTCGRKEIRKMLKFGNLKISFFLDRELVWSRLRIIVKSAAFFIAMNSTLYGYGEIWEVNVSLQSFNTSFHHRHFIIHHKHELNTWTTWTIKYFSISIRMFIVHKNSSMNHTRLSKYWKQYINFSLDSLTGTQLFLSVILLITLLVYYDMV